MNPRHSFMLVLALLALTAGALHAQGTGRGPTGQLLYPAKGQTAQQARSDRFECHEWAREQSGFDPTQMAAEPAPATAPVPMPAQPPTASARGSAVAGAAGGAALAELADKDTGKGAAIGLLGGGLRQQVQNRQGAAQQPAQQQALLQAQQHAQQQAQQRAAAAQRRDGYDRGFAACMEARHYIVR